MLSKKNGGVATFKLTLRISVDSSIMMPIVGDFRVRICSFIQVRKTCARLIRNSLAASWPTSGWPTYCESSVGPGKNSEPPKVVYGVHCRRLVCRVWPDNLYILHFVKFEKFGKLLSQSSFLNWLLKASLKNNLHRGSKRLNSRKNSRSRER